MNIQKRTNLINSLIASIHTMQLIADNLDSSIASTDSHLREINTLADGRIRMIFNANKGLMDGSGLLESYSDTKEVLMDSLSCAGAKNTFITRIDICLNTFQLGDFELYKKLFRLLVCCVAFCENLKNCYQTKTLWDFADLNVAVKSNSIECENYNKELESNGLVPTTNRIEFRSKGLKNQERSIDETVLAEKEKWFLILDRASKKDIFRSVQKKYNEGLIKKYKELESTNKITSINSFVVQYSDAIFTHSQMVEFLEVLGVSNPELSARKIKQRYKIEFFSHKDLLELVKGINNSINEYFEN